MAGYVIAVFGLGLGIGLALGTGSRGGQRANGPTRGTDRPETPEESLARLSAQKQVPQSRTGALRGSVDAPSIGPVGRAGQSGVSC